MAEGSGLAGIGFVGFVSPGHPGAEGGGDGGQHAPPPLSPSYPWGEAEDSVLKVLTFILAHNIRRIANRTA